MQDDLPPADAAAERYVRPEVLRLEFAMDAPVSMGQNCKTAQSSNVGTTPCSPPGGARPCQTMGS
jgi:hypothetical protein